MDSIVAIIISVLAAIVGIVLYGKFKPKPGQPTISVEEILKARTNAHADIKEWEKDEKEKIDRMDDGSVVATANDILRKRRDNTDRDDGRPSRPDGPGRP